MTRTTTKRAKPTTRPRKATASKAERPVEDEVRSVLTWLERKGSKRNRDGMARYAIPSDNAFGVSVGTLRQLAKRLGRNHELAHALWGTGKYEARMLASLVAQPERLTPAEMERWAKEFDSWAICDTMCFHLFDRSPHAWEMVERWSDRREEFVRRSAYALLASLTVHDKEAADRAYLRGLVHIERAATDDRNFVMKAVNWALRSIGKRNQTLNAAAVTVARRLAESPQSAARWVGKDALRELTSGSVTKRLPARAKKSRPTK